MLGVGWVSDPSVTRNIEVKIVQPVIRGESYPQISQMTQMEKETLICVICEICG